MASTWSTSVRSNNAGVPPISGGHHRSTQTHEIRLLGADRRQEAHPHAQLLLHPGSWGQPELQRTAWTPGASRDRRCLADLRPGDLRGSASIISAAAWAMGSFGSNSHYAGKGKVGCLIAAGAAILIASANAIIRFFSGSRSDRGRSTMAWSDCLLNPVSCVVGELRRDCRELGLGLVSQVVGERPGGSLRDGVPTLQYQYVAEVRSEVVERQPRPHGRGLPAHPCRSLRPAMHIGSNSARTRPTRTCRARCRCSVRRACHWLSESSQPVGRWSTTSPGHSWDRCHRRRHQADDRPHGVPDRPDARWRPAPGRAVGTARDVLAVLRHAAPRSRADRVRRLRPDRAGELDLVCDQTLATQVGRDRRSVAVLEGRHGRRVHPRLLGGRRIRAGERLRISAASSRESC